MAAKKILKSDYQKAQAIIAKYKIQTNRELLKKDFICSCCLTNTIEPISFNVDTIDINEPERSMWNNGTVRRISFGYGSRHDGESFLVAICDDCIEKLETEKKAINFSKLKKEEKQYYF